MGYTVTGAVVEIDGGETALRWRMLQGLSAQVTEFTATVPIPTQFSSSTSDCRRRRTRRRARHPRLLGARAAAPLHGRCAAGRARANGGGVAARPRAAARRSRVTARAAMGLRAARGGHDGVAPRPSPAQRLRDRPRGCARLLAIAAAPPGGPGARAARRPAQGRGQPRRGRLRMAGAVPAARDHRVPCTRARSIPRRWHCAAAGGVAALSVPPQWTETHPRTLHLLNEEVAAWERGGPLQLELRS